MGADYDPKQSGSPWSDLALVMEARSKAQGAAIVAGHMEGHGTRPFFRLAGCKSSVGRSLLCLEPIGSTDVVVVGGWPLSVAAAALAAVATLTP